MENQNQNPKSGAGFTKWREDTKRKYEKPTRLSRCAGRLHRSAGRSQEHPRTHPGKCFNHGRHGSTRKRCIQGLQAWGRLHLTTFSWRSNEAQPSRGHGRRVSKFEERSGHGAIVKTRFLGQGTDVLCARVGSRVGCTSVPTWGLGPRAFSVAEGHAELRRFHPMAALEDRSH